MKKWIKLLRPHHWIKNLLIFAPLFFARSTISITTVKEGLTLFFSFSLLASTVYIINDIIDKEADKKHPIKKNRPIASGEIQKSKALILAVILLAVTATLSLSFPQKVLIALTSYLTINLLYSLWLKHVVIIDIFLIASLYLIRIFAGGKLWDIYISHWLMLCTFFLALFLISAKRRAEFCQQDENTNSTRKVIKSYNKIFLDHMLTITTTSSLVGYSLYVVNAEQPYFLYSVIFVAFGLFRYLYVVCQYNIGQFPEKVIFTDPWIFSSIALWGTYSLIVLYVI